MVIRNRDCINMVIFGPPGVGKGTQAKKISDKYGIPHISTGDLLRKVRADETHVFHEKVKECMDAGELVDDEITNEILADRLREPDCSVGYIIDGYPRNQVQVHTLKGMLYGAGLDKANIVIALTASEDILIERAVGRRTCSNKECKATYHVKNDPPKKEGICDKCGSPLTVRKDDCEETVRNRLKVYRDMSVPLLPIYAGKGLVDTVDGLGSIDEVFAKIEVAIAARGLRNLGLQKDSALARLVAQGSKI